MTSVSNDELDKMVIARDTAATTPKSKSRMPQNSRSGAGTQPLKLTFYRDFGNVANKRHLIKGVLAANETSVWIGPPGSNKSALAAELAVRYTSGDEWRGHRIKERGGVCYFAFERADLVMRRIYALKLRDGLPPDLPISVAREILDLLDPRCVEVIVATIRYAEKQFDCAARIAVFDTYNKGIAIGGGDEDKARDQNRALGHLRRVQELCPGLHVMAIGHTGKDEGRGARGSNALPGDADMQNQISVDGDVMIVTTTKANDAPQGELIRFKAEPFVFGVDEDGDPVSVNILAPDIIAIRTGTNQPKTRARPSRGARDLRDAIIHVLDGQAEKIQIDGGKLVTAVDVKKVQADFNRRYVVSESGDDGDVRNNKNAKYKAFNRALEHLPQDFIGREVNGKQWICKV